MTVKIDQFHLERMPADSHHRWLTDDDGAALEEMQRLALHDLPLQDDVFTVRAMLAALALCKGQIELGA